MNVFNQVSSQVFVYCVLCHHQAVCSVAPPPLASEAGTSSAQSVVKAKHSMLKALSRKGVAPARPYSPKDYIFITFSLIPKNDIK